ncbi:dynein regulatory complex subunit 7-like isoform X2 [Myzus persicae]|uniref:dynein regulatory complex subunit 7-like isoform X2 n=1 Tax=Myzus persicae TaxID=13164 RepID=UPI000B937277|nr:dynein regulatory complex subunit 7-like isoform X2 [Myzus persicae]
MDSDSLDWIWGDFNNSPNLAELFEEVEDDNYTLFDSNDDDKSDSSSESSFNNDCSLLIGDQKSAQELNEIVNDIKIQYDKTLSELNTTTDGELEDDNHISIDKLYIDALEAVKTNLSDIELEWADTLYQCTVNEKTVPESYTKTTSIEKLIILYANNFVEQFKIKYPNRRQLVLVLLNECGVQKCVCTAIKPSRLVYPNLKDLISYSEFVAKHITYIKLEDPVAVPNKIMSPTTTIEMQTANCFEMAILLVSFLIGCEYNAFVVYGYASEIVCNNDLRKVRIDLEEYDQEKSDSENNSENLDDANSLEPKNDLCSKYVKFLIEEEKNKTVVKDEVKEINFNDSSDSLFGKRVHAWVIIIPLKIEDENINEIPYFIEPSTGERKEVYDENYTGIEAIWNHRNYWINLQSLDAGCSYNFNLTNTKCWEQFLPDKPQHLGGGTLDLQFNENTTFKHLVMPSSWVNVLEVPRNKYYMLYPSGKKVVTYMNAIKEFYADYIMPDGLIEKNTFFNDSEYVNKTFVTEIYKHRIDKLISVETKYTAKENETVEYFRSGRGDFLKTHKFYGDCNNIETKRFLTFYNLRLDSMAELKIDKNSFTTAFNDRSDLLFWRKCVLQQIENNDCQNLNVKRKSMSIVEKYLRDETKHKDRDIATISFNLEFNSIYVQYQYGEGQITQSSRLFQKPTMTRNEEFDPKSVIEDIVYPYEGHLNAREAYLMLQDMIEAEKEALRNVSKLEDDVLKMIEIRSRERTVFKLKIDSLDWDRNHGIRKLLQNEKDKKLALSKRDKSKQVENSLPYHVIIKRLFTQDNNALNVREKIIQNFKQKTKKRFTQTKHLFATKQFKLQSMMKALETDRFKEVELKNKTLILCSLLKNELNVLTLRMERYNETRTERYNNLASYLNSYPDFKSLSPLKLYF